MTGIIFFYKLLIENGFHFRLHMNSNTAVKFAPVFTEDKKIEVSLTEGEAVIRLSTWQGDDLGWCGQKTMSLDTAMIDELHRVLTAAKMKLHRENEISQPANILDFPKFISE